jgi:Zinc knuckle
MKSERNGTGGNHTSSGEASGNSKGSGPNGKLILGKTKELGELVYKTNTKDQADMYLRTTEAIADYVGVEYGRDMRMLVKRSNEVIFKEPEDPATGKPGISMEKYKAELSLYHKENKLYKENKSKVFVIILGQCTLVVKSKLENDEDFEQLELNDDVVGLLKMLKQMAFSTAGIQEPFWTLQTLLRRLTAINQGPNESVANYYRRTNTNIEVMESQWGMFHPTKGLTGDDNKKKARDKLLAMIFLAGADKKRYGRLLEDLNNAYLAKKDNYPESMESTLTLLTHYQDGSNGKTVDGGNDGQLATSFAQKKLQKIRCYLCKKTGHYKKDCPDRQLQNFQGEDDDEQDEPRSVRGRISEEDAWAA